MRSRFDYPVRIGFFKPNLGELINDNVGGPPGQKLLWPTNLTNDTNGEEAKVVLFVPFARFVGNSACPIDVWGNIHHSPLFAGFSTAGSCGVAPFPQGMRVYVEQFARAKPESFPRGAGVLACRLPHRPGAYPFCPKSQAPDPKPIRGISG